MFEKHTLSIKGRHKIRNDVNLLNVGLTMLYTLSDPLSSRRLGGYISFS